MHDQQFPPWGIVTPEFWAAPEAEAAVAQPLPVAAAPAPMPPTTASGAPVLDEEPARAEAEPAAEEGNPPALEALPEATSGEPLPPPEKHCAAIAAITAAFNAPKNPTRLAQAAIDAEKLDGQITAEYGPAHQHTINARELRGWAAYLSGQPDVAARWFLHTTGLQAAAWGPTHAQTQGSAQRAVHAWLLITDSQGARALGPTLLTMLAAVAGEDSHFSTLVRSRLEQLR
ncbi:hypothetical protein [Streptomyces syringium]|uniref:hypothetical protein n=1 Tax=Streptomyces syringium TaxID=76729 RepID=UPI0037D68E6B